MIVHVYRCSFSPIRKGHKSRMLNSHTTPTTILEKYLKLTQAYKLSDLSGSSSTMYDTTCEESQMTRKHRTQSNKVRRDKSRLDTVSHNK